MRAMAKTAQKVIIWWLGVVTLESKQHPIVSPCILQFLRGTTFVCKKKLFH